MEDNGVTTRILSQLLWWLSEHRSKVLTLMTTNNQEALPPELYRPGRLDIVIHLPQLSLAQAKDFASQVFRSILGVPPSMKQQNLMRKALDAGGLLHPPDSPLMAHSEVTELVYTLIKQHKWLPFELD
jgi:SpoVK/Ycf46/Vps4 family AAA+-type ATPase